MPKYFSLLLALVLALPLAACSGTGALLSNVALSAPVLNPNGAGTSVTLSYTIGRPAKVWITVADAQGQQYTLRDGDTRQPSADPYSLRFDGAVPTGQTPLIQRLLPAGSYTLSVRAQATDGSEASQQVPLQITGDAIPPPQVDNLVVAPAVISPNADGIDDVAEFTYSLPVSATVDITISAPDGTVYPFVTNQQAAPELQRQVWTGKTGDGATLPDGTYGFTLRAQDGYGNVVEQRGALGIIDGGLPEATIIDSRIAPQAILLGEVITVTLRVKNTGKVPIRTYGPPSGYEYSTKEVFSSVAAGAYDAKSGGFWRVGMDWDANSGGGPKRYPFRWAISPRPPAEWKVPNVEDVLLPGEEAVVVGRIRVEQQETKIGFYVGLIQDGVGFRQDRLGRTIVQVGF